MEKEPVLLSQGEWQVMEALWEGPKTLMELVRLLKDRVLVTYHQEGRTKTFRAAVSREEAAAAETESLLQRAYHGSVGLLVNTLAQREALTREDIDELYAILRKAEEEVP